MIIISAAFLMVIFILAAIRGTIRDVDKETRRDLIIKNYMEMSICLICFCLLVGIISYNIISGIILAIIGLLLLSASMWDDLSRCR